MTRPCRNCCGTAASRSPAGWSTPPTPPCSAPSRSTGSSCECVYKPVRGERPLWDFPDGTLAGREVATYLMSEAGGFHLVPPDGAARRPVRAGDGADLGRHRRRARARRRVRAPPTCRRGGSGCCAPAATAASRPCSCTPTSPSCRRWPRSTCVVNNADRKGGHVLAGVDGHVYGVDHGLCLHTEDKLRTVLWGWVGKRLPARWSSSVRTAAHRARRRALRRRSASTSRGASCARSSAGWSTCWTSPATPSRPGYGPAIPWPAF